MKLRVLFMMMWVATGACAQTPASDTGAQADGANDRKLPAEIIGTYSPYSKSLRGYGELSIGANDFSWGECTHVPYALVRAGHGYLLEFEPSACTLSPSSNFLILKLSGNQMQVWICDDAGEFDRPERDRNCSWGLLGKTG